MKQERKKRGRKMKMEDRRDRGEIECVNKKGQGNEEMGIS